MRLIDADALKADYFTTTPTTGTTSTMYVSLYQILNAPTVEERKTGKWRRTPMACYGGGTITEYECSVCEEHQIITSNYCPNCGADMRQGGEDHETD